MSGARLRALVGLALWTLSLLAIVAVAVAIVAACAGVAVRDSWVWETYKTLAQLVVAALGVGFAYAFPLRLQAQKAYSELRAAVIELATDMESSARGTLDPGRVATLTVRSIEVRARLAALGAAEALVTAVCDVTTAVSMQSETQKHVLSEEPNLWRILNRSPRHSQLLEQVSRARGRSLATAATLAQLAAETPAP